MEGSSAEQTRTGPGSARQRAPRARPALSVLVGHRSRGRSLRATSTSSVRATGHRGDDRAGRVHLRRRPGAHERRARPRRSQVVPSRLTLVTSDPAFTPDRTLVVSAQLARRRAAGQHRLDRPRLRDTPGRAAPARLIALLLWAQLLLLTTVARRPGPRSATRVAGCGSGRRRCCSPSLWKVFENLAVLLPNTLPTGRPTMTLIDAPTTTPRPPGASAAPWPRPPGHARRRRRERVVRRPPRARRRRPDDAAPARSPR